jgi:CHASE2 domain-containing sensor protein
MNHGTRNAIAIVSISAAIVCVIAFVVQHFMPARPSWHKDLPWLALTFVIVSEIVRRQRRRSRQM